MARAVLFDRHPFEHTVRWRTIANVLSMGFVVSVKLRSLHSGHQSSRGSADLARIVESFAESSIKLASLVLPANSLPRQKLREIVDAAAAAGLRVVLLSSTCEKADDAFAFELIEVADLLGREPVDLRIESIDALIRGRSFVVTGGGGSIGSELWGHLLRGGPVKLVIIDHSEFNLFGIGGSGSCTLKASLGTASMHQRQRRWLS